MNKKNKYSDSFKDPNSIDSKNSNTTQAQDEQPNWMEIFNCYQNELTLEYSKRVFYFLTALNQYWTWDLGIQ